MGVDRQEQEVEEEGKVIGKDIRVSVDIAAVAQTLS